MMMMMGEAAPPWSFDGTAGGGGDGGDSQPYLSALAAALQRYLPSNEVAAAAYDSDELLDSPDAAVDAYACDEFRMYEFKVRRCARGRAHDWTECPYAHPGEKARRRDPRKYHYSGAACPDFRKGNCKRGDACEFAHGVFECWLHPARYRTQPCKDGIACRRRVCFFAHTPDQLRVLPQQPPPVSPRVSAAMLESYDGSSLRRQAAALEVYLPVSPPSESPPVSPGVRRVVMNEVVESMRQLQVGKVKSMPRSLVRSPVGSGGGLFGSSPRVSAGFRRGFGSLPSTPTVGMGGGSGGVWMEGGFVKESEGEPEVRVESGRALRARMFERLSKESGLESPPVAVAGGQAADAGWWVS